MAYSPHMPFFKYRAKDSAVAKMSAFVLAFLLLIAPFAPVFAQEAAETVPEEAPVAVSEQAPVVTEPVPTAIDSLADLGTTKEDVPTAAELKKDPETPPMSMMSLSGGTSTEPASIEPQESKKATPEIDQATGSLAYSYPIEILAGRSGMAPDLKLSYNSQSLKPQSVAGYGWSVPIPFITRTPKHGVNSLYGTGAFFHDFVSSLDGDLTMVTSAGTSDPDEGTYAAKTENGQFLSYSYLSGAWTVTDKRGQTYVFGATAADRQDDPANPSHVYKWMLSETRDANNNFVDYSYYKHAGQIYPDTIAYTGNGATAGIYEVKFVRESDASMPKSNETGFSVDTQYRVKDIEVRVSGTLAKTYHLAYSLGQNGARTLLASVAAIDPATGASLVTSFDYTTNRSTLPAALGFSSIVPVDPTIQLQGCGVGSSSWMQCGARFADINGDGLPDYVASAGDFNGWGTSTYNYAERVRIYFNKGSGFVNSGWTLPTRTTTLTLAPGTGPLSVTFFDDQYDFMSHHHPNALQLLDVNNDGRADLVWQDPSAVITGLNPVCSTSPWKVYINNGAGWTYDPSWTAPIVSAWGCKLAMTENVMQFADINADGWVDVYLGYNDPFYGGAQMIPFFNDHAGHWIEDVTSGVDLAGVVPEWWPVFGPSRDSGFTRLLDMNLDGLPDIVVSIRTTQRMDGTSVPNTAPTFKPDQGEWYYVYMNTGTKWKYDPTPVQLPVNSRTFVVSQLTYPTVHPSRIVFESADENNLSPLYLPVVYVNNWYDLNGDNLPDIMDFSSVYDSQNNLSWNIDAGSSAAYVAHPRPYEYQQAGSPGAAGTPMADFDGDGIIDYFDDLSGPKEHLNGHEPADLLSRITLSSGGTVAVAYKPSTQYLSGGGSLLNPEFPAVLQTVHTVTTTDPVSGVSGTTTYSYEGGKYFAGGAFDRRFAGFHTVTKVDAAGNKTVTYYHQGDATDSLLGEFADMGPKIGKAYRVEEYDAADFLYRLTVNKWDNFNLGVDRDFVKLARATVLQYDGNSTHRDTAEEYSYDNANGNILQKVAWGEVTAANDGSFVDIGTDKSTESISYAAPATGSVVGLPSDDILTDQLGATVRQTRTYYDGLPLGWVTLGNATKEERRASGTGFVNTQKTYDAYGLTTSSTDENGSVTGYVYDANHLFPATVTNALGHATAYVYDYAAGKPVRMTDPNGFVYETTYDGFGRTLVEKIPGDTSPYTPVLKTTYAYVDTAGAVSVHRVDYLDASNAVDTYQYMDGLGRSMQARRESEIPGSYVVTDTAYDARGLTQKQSLPYLSGGSARTAPTGVTALYSTTLYDPLRRPSSVATAVGTTAYAYDDWRTTVVDPLAHAKAYEKDARGNLVRVIEVNGMATYFTVYDWDLNGKLITITDALGNVRHFAYDMLGRRLSAEDLHDPSDASFGTWSYLYDPAGNMVQSTSPMGAIVTYAYDALSRQASEDDSGSPGTEIAYAYDACTNGVGKLCSVTMLSGADTAYTYDSNGRMADESRTIGSAPSAYVTAYVYDRQGNMLTLTYPDGAVARYSYNTGGQLEKVESRESTTSFTDVVSNFDYSPTGQPSTILYANGVTTTNAYDAAHLYRLIGRVTVGAGLVNLQDNAYTYDAVGNITQNIDASATSSSKTVAYTYDDLNRLISATATGVATGMTPYTETYAYDTIGNIVSGPAGAYLYLGSTGGSYANPHAVTSIAGGAVAYDNDGNILSDTTVANASRYVWNYKGQATDIDYGTARQTMTYDHSGNRASLFEAMGTDYYPNKYYKVDWAGTITKDIYAGSQLLATLETSGATVTPHFVHADPTLGASVVTGLTGIGIQTLDYYPFGASRLNQKTTSFDEEKQFGGHYYHAGTELSYLGARYMDTSVGRFVSEDPSFLVLGDAGRTQAMTGQDMNSVLADPQSLNSYAYARNNPITKIDPNGRWYKELLTGNQSWSSFMGEVGEATQYMGSGWQTAMDHPYAAGAAVGVAGGLAAYGAAAAITQINVGINLANLDQLPMESRVDTMANKGFDAIQKATGLAKGDAVNLVKSGGGSLVDLRNGGNINNIANYGEKAIRITTTPDASKIISSGIMNPAKIPGYVSSGAMQPLPFLSSVAKSAAQFIGNIGK
jgi:RHS repeat-associated protein